MLSSLQIENVAVIQKANVHFEKGLNVLTGETGAGKSILIDSINAILGNRTSKDPAASTECLPQQPFCGNCAAGSSTSTASTIP